LRKIKVFFGFALVISMILSGCDRLPVDLPFFRNGTQTATLQPGSEDQQTPTPQVTETVIATPGPVTQLTIWVPPEMDPALETEASQLFADRLEEFSELNDGLEIHVRVKAASGVAGLLDSLTAASAAAPGALPDLIALPRTDLEAAALKGLIYPLEGFTQIPDDEDWYPFTREMSLLQGSTFGLPFAADSLAIVFRPSIFDAFPASWDDLFMQKSAITFAAGSDQALFVLSLYRSEGGEILDSQRRPILEVDPLTEVFRLIDEGVEAGVFPEDLVENQNDQQVWTAFREGQKDLVITWLSNYLKEGPADSSVASLLPISDQAVSLATGMSWAVASKETHRHPMAVELAEFLIQPEYLSDWSAAAGYIPTRPSALEGWKNQSLRKVVGEIALISQLSPSSDIIASLGPVLKESSVQILQQRVDPAQAAIVAVESLEE
jgi:ABC-type glycerol-3-phosphate transport system substrate-binding protein